MKEHWECVDSYCCIVVSDTRLEWQNVGNYKQGPPRDRGNFFVALVNQLLELATKIKPMEKLLGWILLSNQLQTDHVT